jgi:hypothetical protein
MASEIVTYGDLVHFKNPIVNWVVELNPTFVIVINFHINESYSWSDMHFFVEYFLVMEIKFSGFWTSVFHVGHLFVIWNAFHGFNKM